MAAAHAAVITGLSTHEDAIDSHAGPNPATHNWMSGVASPCAEGDWQRGLCLMLQARNGGSVLNGAVSRCELCPAASWRWPHDDRMGLRRHLRPANSP